mmetsp:Transcript_40423/g.79682  ORF Transcript_40423/g.79682 Transcript_40423/m.79682 type:complete len:107 (+) Transcript_40423:71-391(+)
MPPLSDPRESRNTDVANAFALTPYSRASFKPHKCTKKTSNFVREAGIRRSYCLSVCLSVCLALFLLLLSFFGLREKRAKAGRTLRQVKKRKTNAVSLLFSLIFLRR